MGHHRGSVFRKHVGLALLNREGVEHPTWGVGATADRHVVEGERELEERVSAYLARLLVTVLPVLDEPGPTSMRGYVERNAIGLLTRHCTPGAWPTLRASSAAWLGRHARTHAVRASGLWNVNHVGERPEAAFIGRLEQLVRGSSQLN